MKLNESSPTSDQQLLKSSLDETIADVKDQLSNEETDKISLNAQIELEEIEPAENKENSNDLAEVKAANVPENLAMDLEAKNEEADEYSEKNKEVQDADEATPDDIKKKRKEAKESLELLKDIEFAGKLSKSKILQAEIVSDDYLDLDTYESESETENSITDAKSVEEGVETLSLFGDVSDVAEDCETRDGANEPEGVPLPTLSKPTNTRKSVTKFFVCLSDSILT